MTECHFERVLLQRASGASRESGVDSKAVGIELTESERVMVDRAQQQVPGEGTEQAAGDD